MSNVVSLILKGERGILWHPDAVNIVASYKMCHLACVKHWHACCKRHVTSYLLSLRSCAELISSLQTCTILAVYNLLLTNLADHGQTMVHAYHLVTERSSLRLTVTNRIVTWKQSNTPTVLCLLVSASDHYLPLQSLRTEARFHETEPQQA